MRRKWNMPSTWIKGGYYAPSSLNKYITLEKNKQNVIKIKKSQRTEQKALENIQEEMWKNKAE